MVPTHEMEGRCDFSGAGTKFWAFRTLRESCGQQNSDAASEGSMTTPGSGSSAGPERTLKKADSVPIQKSKKSASSLGRTAGSSPPSSESENAYKSPRKNATKQLEFQQLFNLPDEEVIEGQQ